ncbi:PST family polysaccharide transporter [Bacillus ectoiniformans]|nr:PST family polysaccharide transporter [Bacillus ectoiniformans]
MKSFMRGAVILTVAAIFVKVLSAVYRVPFQNIVGDVGFYIYQQVYPFYGISVALSTYGFPVMISKLVAERKGHPTDLREIIRVSFYVISTAGGFLFILLFFGAERMANGMGDPLLAPLIQLSAFSFLLMPFLTVWRGAYQGLGDMVPTAVSQSGEQLVRVVFILLFAYILIRNEFSLYVTGAGALAGSLMGSLAGIFVLWLYMRRRPLGAREEPAAAQVNRKELIRSLVYRGTAICLASMMLVLMQLMDSFHLYSGLIHAGVNEWEAKVAKGIYDRGQPLLQLGTVVAASLSLTLVPLVTAAYKKQLPKEVDQAIQLALKVSFTISFAAAVGIINIMKPLNSMLFENYDGSDVLSVFCLSIIFSSVILTLSGILQGIGEDFTPAIAVIAGLLFKWAGNYLLIPVYGTMGAAVSTVAALAGIALFLALKIRIKLKTKYLHGYFMAKVLFSASCMTVLLRIWILLSSSFITGMIGNERLQMVMITCSSVFVGAFVFIYVIVKLKLFTDDELRQIPFGSKLEKLSRKIR